MVANATEIAVGALNKAFLAGKLPQAEYLSAIAGLSGSSSAPSSAPVETSQAKPSARNDSSRRIYVKAQVSENFDFGHITLSKNNRRFGIWAEDVASVIEQLSTAFDALPESVQAQASLSNNA